MAGFGADTTTVVGGADKTTLDKVADKTSAVHKGNFILNLRENECSR